MSLLSLLVGGILFACILIFWKNPFQRNIEEMSTSSTSLALVTPSFFTGSTKSSNSNSFSENSRSEESLTKSPHSMARRKQILLDLRMLEYQLVELEHSLVMKGFKHPLLKRKLMRMLVKCTDIRGKH